MVTLSPTLRSALHDPIASSLLFSLSVHLALFALIQPAPGGGSTETLVINSRLEMPGDAPVATQALPETSPETLPEVPPEVPPPPVPQPAVEPRPEVPPPAKPQPLLTSNVASPAPPLPLAPSPSAPVEARPPQVSVTAALPAAAVAAPSGPAPRPNGSSTPFSIGIDATWYVARQVDMHARSLGSVVPAYPEQARRRNQEGTLKLMLKIDDFGRVRDVEVVEADLPGVFDEAAIDAFKNARFQPAMKEGRPVRYQAYIRVTFKLHD